MRSAVAVAVSAFMIEAYHARFAHSITWQVMVSRSEAGFVI